MTGVGPTPELCLRVSAAALARVTFAHPHTGDTYLALERKATMPKGTVIAQPYGGGMHLLRPEALRALVVNFHFDSPRSRDEADFRILIRPADWGRVKQWCLDAFRQGRADLLEMDPARELAEEFWDTLRLRLAPSQYHLRPDEIVVENTPARTGNVHAAGLPTTRIYAVSEARITDPALAQALLAASALPDDALLEQARGDADRGRANGVLTLPLARLVESYRALSPTQRGEAQRIEGYLMEGNVTAVLPGVEVEKYERYPVLEG